MTVSMGNRPGPASPSAALSMALDGVGRLSSSIRIAWLGLGGASLPLLTKRPCQACLAFFALLAEGLGLAIFHLPFRSMDTDSDGSAPRRTLHRAIGNNPPLTPANSSANSDDVGS